jgi:alpha-L-rhamnosidase
MLRFLVSFILMGSLVFCSLISPAVSEGKGLQVTGMQCNNKENPLGINPDRVTFSWQMESDQRGEIQTAYQLLLASTLEKLTSGEADVWDSGKVISRQSLQLPCRHNALASGQRYFWKVRVWDKEGIVSSWSPDGNFVTGLRSPADWGDSRWIGYEELPGQFHLKPGIHSIGKDQTFKFQRPITPLLRKTLELKKQVKSAFIFISGLGHYELYSNGSKVGDDFLAPGWTDYDKTCLYNTYDLTHRLTPGKNSLGVIVGNGFYNITPERYWKLSLAYGMPKIICQLHIEYEDGSRETISSGPEWRCAPSPITFTSIYGGEDYDARMEQPGWATPNFDDSAWKKVLTVAAPQGQLKAEEAYPLKVLEEIPVSKITRPASGAYLYDFGQNCSGVVRLTVQGRKGQTLRLIPAELLNRNAQANQKASGAPYLWSYTLRGEQPEIWIPRFTYYGFRYVQVEGADPASALGTADRPQILDLKLLHTRNSAPVRGHFECSSELLNRIYHLIDWAIRSNFASVLTDCPHREKLGWLEQTYLMGEGIHFNYDLYHLYSKQVHDMMDAQQASGLVPDIAPEYVEFVSGFRDSPEWGSASIILPMLLYRWYGDQGPLEEAYPVMKRYVDYLGTKADRHILSHGLGDWYDLGPRFPGEAQLTPKALTATAIYYYDVKLLEKSAGLLGLRADETRYQKLAEEIQQAFNKHFFNQETGIYSTGSQTAMAMPLCVGLVEERNREKVFNNLIRAINGKGKALTAGDIGFHFLVKALADGGAADLLYTMNSREDVPGYGFQLKKNATALTESWAALKEVSNNHLMLGHIMEWFFTGLAGINQAEDSTAYEKIVIRPQMIEALQWTRSEFDCPYGKIRSSWKGAAGARILEVEIPVNAQAEVQIPFKDGMALFESGRAIGTCPEIALKKPANGKWFLTIGSGKYRFEIKAAK